MVCMCWGTWNVNTSDLQSLRNELEMGLEDLELKPTLLSVTCIQA